MLPHFLIPLAIACVSTWISLSNAMSWIDELPRLLAGVIGTVSSMWFFVVTPWPVKLSLIVGLLIFGNFVLRDEITIR
ncbi:hypothetical protein [Lyngbya sp. CCY1209]|jgi:hypothetical protein|uniref:hypothetical protein n=1 Tax=Lyngbya sp. CCY1209 TaxID=2886103 RepID=UPI002D21389C|nr:hypothetical protein [Lyngbya sp. CCY1209]MEB3885203.1 hypothetical protein [Lyngbya sp. CCY1209]